MARALAIAFVVFLAQPAWSGTIQIINTDQTQTRYRESDDNNSGGYSQFTASGTGVRDDCGTDTCRLTVNGVTGDFIETFSELPASTAAVDIGINAVTFADSANVAFTGGQYVEGEINLTFDISINMDNDGFAWSLDLGQLLAGSLIQSCDLGCDNSGDGGQATVAGLTASVNGSSSSFSYSDSITTNGSSQNKTFSSGTSGDMAAFLSGTGDAVIPVSMQFNIESYSAQDGSFGGINGDEMTSNATFTGTYTLTVPEPATLFLAGIGALGLIIAGGRARRS